MPSEKYLSQETFAALNEAALAVASSDLALDKVLWQIVESARKLVGARYAALGVPNVDGDLEAFVHRGMPSEMAAQIPHLPEGRGLLGAIIEEKRTIRIPRISRDPRTVGFPAGHPRMESFLGVPIMAGDEVLGNLYLTEKFGADEFSKSDQELIELLAAHAAIAIQNARLYEEVGRLAVVAERSRIGMDLHDGVIQAVYAVGLTLESARMSLPQEQDEAIALIDGAIAGLNDAIRDIRNFILDLRPRRFEGDLGEGLARLAREFQANTMVPVTLDAPPGILSDVPLSVARAIFFTTQEALANTARHAKASGVDIRLARGNGEVSLWVEDDGQGFDPAGQTNTTGHGLANMRARAEERNGSFHIESAPGEGTRICLKLPLD